MGKKTEKEEKSRLERLVEKAVARQERMALIEEEHEAVFTEWRELNDQVEGLIEQIKIEARKEASEGETRVLVENPNVMVSVVGKRRQIVYDFEKAKQLWPPTVLQACQVSKIDPDKAQRMIDDGKLKLKQIQGVKTLVDVTPAVSVKLTKRS